MRRRHPFPAAPLGSLNAIQTDSGRRSLISSFENKSPGYHSHPVKHYMHTAPRSPKGRACVKTPARFDTDLFCSLFRALRPLGSDKIAKNFALRDCLQKFAGFSHGLDLQRSFGEVPRATPSDAKADVAVSCWFPVSAHWRSECAYSGSSALRMPS